MKKVFTILFALFLLSCKQDQACYECNTKFKITIRDSGGTDTFSIEDTRTKCDVTESEIRAFETANSDSVTYINGDTRIDTVFVTTCKK
jgi:hypothetical protein